MARETDPLSLNRIIQSFFFNPEKSANLPIDLSEEPFATHPPVKGTAPLSAPFLLAAQLFPLPDPLFFSSPPTLPTLITESGQEAMTAPPQSTQECYNPARYLLDSRF